MCTCTKRGLIPWLPLENLGTRLHNTWVVHHTCNCCDKSSMHCLYYYDTRICTHVCNTCMRRDTPAHGWPQSTERVQVVWQLPCSLTSGLKWCRLPYLKWVQTAKDSMSYPLHLCRNTMYKCQNLQRGCLYEKGPCISHYGIAAY